MKISTRILISLVVSLVILGSSLIGISYYNTQHNAKKFVKEYETNAFSFHENELKNIMEMMQHIAMSVY